MSTVILESARRPCLAVVLVLFAAAPPATFAQANWIKLSDGMSFSDVASPFKISPSGDRVVYPHDADVDGAFDLWSVLIGGGPAVRLNSLIPSGAAIIDFSITPDGTRVIYRAPQDTFPVYELYRVPIAGGASVKLSDPLVSGGQVVEMQVSPNGLSVVYRADQETDNAVELYSVPVSGGPVAKLNDPLVPDGDVYEFGISPDGTRVVYLADQDTKDVRELYSVPIAGGSVERLNGPLPSGGEINFFRISPDSTRVVYVGDQQTNDVFELYSVPIAGGAITKLNGSLGANGDVAGFLFSPDGSRVVYLAELVFRELFRVPIDGGTVIKLSGNIVVGSQSNGVFIFRISPDGSRVVFIAAKSDPDILELYSVGITSSLPSLAVKLNGPINEPDHVLEFKISPDSSWVVYRATESTVPKTYRVPLAGGSSELIWDNTRLNASQRFIIAPDSDHAVLQGVGASPADSVERLWRGQLTGAASATAAELVPVADFTAGGSVNNFAIAPDGAVVYRADQETDEVLELYALPSPAFIFADGFES